MARLRSEVAEAEHKVGNLVRISGLLVVRMYLGICRQRRRLGKESLLRPVVAEVNHLDCVVLQANTAKAEAKRLKQQLAKAQAEAERVGSEVDARVAGAQQAAAKEVEAVRAALKKVGTHFGFFLPSRCFVWRASGC